MYPFSQYIFFEGIPNHNIEYGGSDIESEISKDEPTCPPSNQKIVSLERMEVSAMDAPYDVITTISQFTGVRDIEVIPENYFMTSKGIFRSSKKGDDPNERSKRSVSTR